MSKLNPKWEAFCYYYTGSEMGNATRAYAKTYNRDTSTTKSYRTAQASASRLLLNVIISKRISELLEKQGLTDEMVDTHLYFLINQFSDFGTKLRAIQEYNRLKGRVTNKIKVKTNPLNYEQFIMQIAEKEREEERITGHKRPAYAFSSDWKTSD